MTRGYILLLIFIVLEICRGHMPPANPPLLSHASMDVGNIISIVIPESPDENINVEQLTGEFRQQLERIKKQSRVSKLEHGLVTLRKVLPEMSREERRKTMPLIRRFLHGKRFPATENVRNWTKSPVTFVRPRVTLEEERKTSRDFEESSVVTGRRDASVRRNDLGDDLRDDPRHVKVVRQNDPGRREERLVPNEAAAKVNKVADNWANEAWDDDNRGDILIDIESQKNDCGVKQEYPVHQKNLGIGNSRVDHSERTSRFSEIGPGNEEQNADFSRTNERIVPKYRDSPVLENSDLRAIVTAAKVVEPYRNPNCDDAKKSPETFFKQPRSSEPIEGQDSFSSELDQNGRWNVSGLQDFSMNAPQNEARKKKRGHDLYVDRRSIVTFGDSSPNHRIFRPISFRDNRKTRFFRSLDDGDRNLALSILRAANVTTEPTFNIDKNFVAGLRRLLDPSKEPLIAIRKLIFMYEKPSDTNETSVDFGIASPTPTSDSETFFSIKDPTTLI